MNQFQSQALIISLPEETGGSFERPSICLHQASYSIINLRNYQNHRISRKKQSVDKKSLIIGYGNIYCHDDGVAFYVINNLRKKKGLPDLRPDEDGLDGLGHSLDTVLLHQLVPETIPVLSQYQQVVFVDAHKGTIPEDVRVVRVKEELGFHAVTHHMSPGLLLALARQTYHVAPEAYLVSVKGEDFDFGLGLSEPCKLRAEMATQTILELVDPKAK
jgi:hydrogenase maturation protease